jgi:hypothetical protein
MERSVRAICIYGVGRIGQLTSTRGTRSICMGDGKDRTMIAVKNDEDDDNDTHV